MHLARGGAADRPGDRGRGEPLGSLGGAGKTGVIGADTELVASHLKRETVS